MLKTQNVNKGIQITADWRLSNLTIPIGILKPLPLSLLLFLKCCVFSFTIMLLRVLRQPSALSVLRKTLSCAAVANKKIEIKDHYDFDKKVRE